MSARVQDSPNVSWLDEELRKAKQVITDLRDRGEKQQVIIADQAQRLLSLEDRLAKLQAQLTRIPDVEEALRHTRDEVVLLVSELRQEHQKRETDFLRNRQAEREQDVRAIQEMAAQLEHIEALEQALAVRQAEERRLNETLMRQQQTLDELTRRVTRREEADRQLAERLEQSTVKVAQASEGLEAQHKRLQELQARLLLVETSAVKNEQSIAELQNMRQEIAEEQSEMVEAQRRADRERAQTLTEWGRRLETYAHQLEVWTEQLRYYADQHEKNRRTLREIQELAHHVSQQQDQLRQLQRVTEDQLRHEMREWQAEYERRWAQEGERRERAGEAQHARDSEQEERLASLEEFREAAIKVHETIDARLASTQADYQAHLRDLKREQLRILKAQAKAWQDLLTDLQAFLSQDEG